MRNPGSRNARPGVIRGRTLKCLAVGHGDLIVYAAPIAEAGLIDGAAGVGVKRSGSDSDAETDAEAQAPAAAMPLMGRSGSGQRSDSDSGGGGDGDDCLADHGRISCL